MTSTEQIATTIKRQIGIGTLMTLGASDFAYQATPEPGLTFKARIIPAGMRGVRVMRVTVTLNPRDLYDIAVVYTQTKYGPVLTHYEVSDVYADQLSRILFALDKPGRDD